MPEIACPSCGEPLQPGAVRCPRCAVDLYPKRPSSPGLLWRLLCALAIAALVVGGLLLTEATVGVGLIAGGCLVGILARIAQADAFRRSP